MNLKLSGLNFKKKVKKEDVIKLCTGILLSNIFLFLLFSPSQPQSEIKTEVEEFDRVEIQISAETFTSLKKGKKVSVISSDKSTYFNGEVESISSEESRVSMFIKKQDLFKIQKNVQWIIFPYSENLSSIQKSKRNSYEIYY